MRFESEAEEGGVRRTGMRKRKSEEFHRGRRRMRFVWLMGNFDLVHANSKLMWVMGYLVSIVGRIWLRHLQPFPCLIFVFVFLSFFLSN